MKLTPDQIKEKMLNTKIPWYIKLPDLLWFYFLKWLLMLLFLTILGIGIYREITCENNYYQCDRLWIVMRRMFFSAFGIGIIMLISRLIKNSFVQKQAKSLGISVDVWNIYAKELNLTSF